MVYSRVLNFLNTSPLFDVKDVLIDQSISFIDSRPLKALKGQNIFGIDLVKLHRQIAGNYPQISQLRVVRQMPDIIKVLAKKREILLQVEIHSKFLIVDMEGVTMFYTPTPLPYPLIKGIPLARNKIVLGAPTTNKELKLIIELLAQLRSHPRTSRLKLLKIDAGNLSKIQLLVMPNLQIIIDQDDLSAKVRMLEILFENNKINWNHVKYIDIRFKEPIINETVPLEQK
jgi:cell division septal protein FtsQ